MSNEVRRPAGTQVRRPAGTPIRGSHFRITPDIKAQIDDYSARFGVPTWAIVEAAIRHADPATWDLPTKNDRELPLTG